MFRDAWLMTAKDLRIEARARIAMWQVLPFAVLVLILFAFALGPDANTLRRAAPGLFWLAVLFSMVLTTQRSYSIESGEGTRDVLRLLGIDPAGVFLGKALAVAVQLIAVEVVVGAGLVALFDVRGHDWFLLVGSAVIATIGLAAAGTLYGCLSSGLQVRDTLLPLLVLPVVSPILVAGTRTWQSGLGQAGGATQWLCILGAFGVVYLAMGVALYGPLQEVA